MATEEVKKVVVKKVKTPPRPEELAIDVASQQMIERSREMGVETIFDRAQTMKACNIGVQGTCCKNCAQGPCRLPLPKGGIEGEDTRKGLCGATPETIAARNFSRMVAAGAASHSDHGRGVAETFLAAARKETKDYHIFEFWNEKYLGIHREKLLHRSDNWVEAQLFHFLQHFQGRIEYPFP